MLSFVKSRLSPFRHKSFTQFFFVHSFSLIGIWAFDLARAWIVVSQLGRAEELGLVLLSGAVPGIFFSLYGGVIVDRVDVRRLMIVTKTLLAIMSFFLAFLTEFYQIQLWHLIVFGFFQGSVSAFDSPAYHAVLVRLVPRDDYQQALAINSTNFHASRALGPIIAGFFMAIHGPSLVFLFDGVTYIFLIYLLSQMELRNIKKSVTNTKSSFNDFKSGMNYIFNHAPLRYMVLQLFMALLLLFPLLIVILRAYIKAKFNVNDEQFAYIFTFPATGSLLGSLFFAIIKPKKPLKALYLGIPMTVLSILAISYFSNDLYTTGWAMAFAGFSIYFCFASLTVSLHLTVKEEFRGRMASLLTLGFLSLGPLAGYPIGYIADQVGYEVSMIILALAFAFASILIYLLHKQSLKTKSR